MVVPSSRIVTETEKKWGVLISIQHRLGAVPVGEASLLVACAGVHRRETFEACASIVDEIKIKVPIWKVGYEWL